MLKKILISFTLISLFGCSTDGEIVHKPHYLVDIENVVVVREDWNVNVGEPDYRRIQKLQPFLFNKKIYTVGTKGKINIFDLHGKRLKSHKLPYEASSIATDGQLIVVTTIDGNIIAFSNKDFTQKWLVRLKSEVLVKVLFVEDKVLVRSSLGKITALSAFDGASQWTYQQQTPVLSSRGSSNMVLDDHKVIVGFDNGYLSVINPINGKAFWEKLLSETEGQTELDRINDIDTQLLVENGYVYFIGNDNYLNKYNIKTAQRVWRVKQSSTKGIESNKSLLFITDKSSNVMAISKDTGTLVWKQEKLLYRGITAPMYKDGKLFVGDLVGFVHLLSANTGEIIGRRFIDELGINTAPIHYGDEIYFQTLSSSLIAISTVD